MLEENPIYLAVDKATHKDAMELLDHVHPYIGGVKIGMELFYALGKNIVYDIHEKYHLPIFLDLKLHDIPNTVASALRAVEDLRPRFISIHCSGGHDMLEYAVKSLEKTSTTLLGVTVLTSLGEEDVHNIYQRNTTKEAVLDLAIIAKNAGLRALVCSAHDCQSIRNMFHDYFTLIVPGIRPSDDQKNDQKRTLAPKEALSQGANILVIGRPITQATCPKDACVRILNSLKDT